MNNEEWAARHGRLPNQPAHGGRGIPAPNPVHTENDGYDHQEFRTETNPSGPGNTWDSTAERQENLRAVQEQVQKEASEQRQRRDQEVARQGRK